MLPVDFVAVGLRTILAVCLFPACESLGGKGQNEDTPVKSGGGSCGFCLFTEAGAGRGLGVLAASRKTPGHQAPGTRH